MSGVPDHRILCSWSILRGCIININSMTIQELMATKPPRSSPISERRKWYREYIKSDHWKMKRELAILFYGECCSSCNSVKKIQVHHLSYARLGNEPMDDLMVLCETCHQKAHIINPRNMTITNKREAIIMGCRSKNIRKFKRELRKRQKP